MAWLLVVLRIVHIFAGVLWVGATYSMFLFISPALQAIGPDAQKFVQALNEKGKFSKRMGMASGLTVLSGLLLYGLLFHGLAPLNTGNGLALTLGGLFGLLAMVGGVRAGRMTKQIQALGAEMTAGPKPEQAQQMGQLQEKMGQTVAINAIFMTLSLLGMVLSEYFVI